MSADKDLHHIIVVGGGAGGLELATKLGNKQGKKEKGSNHPHRLYLDTFVETLATRGCGRITQLLRR